VPHFAAAAAKRIGTLLPLSLPPMPPFPLKYGSQRHDPAQPSLIPAAFHRHAAAAAANPSNKGLVLASVGSSY
ncbi:MAG: hypothetical protein JNJ78_11155, partial [Anaerolineae bacterium]|nr:hypothetical protein [Anaerolineae bacterium]